MSKSETLPYWLIEFFDGVVGVIEASSFEYFCLWKEYNGELKKPWVENMVGYVHEVGHIGDMPINVSFRTAVVEGHKLLFYEAISRVVDHKMIRDWIEKNIAAGRNHTDAMNFHNVFHGIPK